jgi:hypothetical protein
MTTGLRPRGLGRTSVRPVVASGNPRHCGNVRISPSARDAVKGTLRRSSGTPYALLAGQISPSHEPHMKPKSAPVNTGADFAAYFTPNPLIPFS